MQTITSKRDYRKVYEDNNLEVLKGNLFIFLTRKNQTENSLAVGIIVNKKVGKAVVRNKVKRRIRAFLRETRPVCPTGKDVIIISKPDSGTSGWREIKKDLSILFTKINN
ncbi:MAG: hypothetical protein APR54_09825 [Candidatus Cloacimonas sp. SDB]|nr:MAG: hypothetical protein APR54_09825 [Candidatus Cloacimonas sp. SDB]